MYKAYSSLHFVSFPFTCLKKIYNFAASYQWSMQQQKPKGWDDIYWKAFT